MGLGYYYRILNPERAVVCLEKALLYLEPTSDFYLASLQFMIEACEEPGDRENAAREAAVWLALYEDFSEGYQIPGYYEKLARKMRTIAE